MDAPKYESLQDMKRDELIAAYDTTTRNTRVHLDFFRNELWRRDLEAAQSHATAAAQTTKRLTWVILVLTLVNVVLVGVQVAA